MKKIFLLIALIVSTQFLTSCLEDKEPEIDPCNDMDWATVNRDGNPICFENADVLLYQANTTKAYVHAQFYKAIDKSAPSLSGFFSIPASGLELNTTYPATGGDFFGAEEVVSGEIMFLSFTTKDAQGTSCISGTFSLTTKNPNSGATTTFTNGKFVDFLPGKNSGGVEACNPF